MSSIFQLVLQVQAKYEEMLFNKPNVIGVATGYKESQGQRTDEPAVVVLVQQKRPNAALSASDRVPNEIDGVRTDVVEVGYVQAQEASNPRARFRPTIPGGVSIGHFQVTAGTLGIMVRDRTTGERFLLSNNHVLANSNQALKGDPILQPAPIDGGQNPGDVVARLERYIPLKYLEGDLTDPQPPEPPPGTPPTPPSPPPGTGGGCDVIDAFVAMGNVLARLSGSQKRIASTAAPQAVSTDARVNLVDAALGRPTDPDMFLDEILGIGPVTATDSPALGMTVGKTGRTTGTTQGSVTLLNTSINIAYNTLAGPRTARFVGQVISSPISQGGDSGSLVVDTATNKAVGLLFAGSPLSTVFTPIDVVLNALNVSIEAEG
ncbi:MAG: hypothetical protein ACOCYT_01045 [Chloroflexota bacterium]